MADSFNTTIAPISTMRPARRTVLAAAAFLPAVASLASASAIAATMIDPDTAILELVSKIEAQGMTCNRLSERHGRLDDEATASVRHLYPERGQGDAEAARAGYLAAQQKAMEQNGTKAAEVAMEAAWEELFRLAGQLALLQASTMDGLKAKASVLHWSEDIILDSIVTDLGSRRGLI